MAEVAPSADKQNEFLEALLNRQYEDFKKLLNDPEVNLTYRYGKPYYNTVLAIACKFKDTEEFVKLLLTKVKPNVNRIVSEPIHHAAENGLTKTLEILLSDKRVLVNAEDGSGRTALHCAAKHFKTDKYSHEQCIRLLMMHPHIDINKPNRQWYTPIHEAASSCKEAVVAMLNYARQDLDLDRYRATGRTARETIEINYPELKDSLPLPARAVSQASDPQIQLINALRNRHTDVFRVLLKQQDSNGSNLLDPNHWYGRPLNATCLEMACREPGCEEFVNILLNSGANPNMVNRVNEKSPIHVAVESGNVKALEVLVELGAADVNATDKVGKSALHYAVSQNLECDNSENFTRCLEYLLQIPKIDINLQDCGGFTPVMLAVLTSNRKALELIIDQQIHVVDFDSAPETYSKPRDLISEHFEDLKDKLPNPNDSVRHERKRDYTSLLYQYLDKQQEDAFVTLLCHREREIPRTCRPECRPETLLQCACKYGLKEAVRSLLYLGFNPNEITNENKYPPIVTACMKRDYQVLEILLLFECNVNTSDINGNTALHYATKNSDLESSILLLSYGANPMYKNIFKEYQMKAKGLKAILDKCIYDRDRSQNGEGHYEVIFDYKFLTSYKQEKNDVSTCRLTMERALLTQACDSRPKIELDLMYFMTQSKEYRELLAHPIVTSFLDMKWKKLRWVSYINIIIYMIFLVSLNFYVSPYGRENVMQEHNNTTLEHGSQILSSENITGGEEESFTKSSLITSVSLWMSFILLCTREAIQFAMSFKMYLNRGENYLDLGIILLTIIRMAIPMSQDGWFIDLITVMVVLLSWTELLLLIGRVSVFAKNIEMLKLVLKNYLLVASFYSIIFLAFVMSFHIVLWNVRSEENWFDSIPMSFLKTFIMITGEFDADKSYFQSIPIVANLLFVLFVMIVSMVILNLLIGVAVNDIQSIQKDAELLSLETRVKVAWEMEMILAGLNIRYVHRYITIFPDYFAETIGTVRPNESRILLIELFSKSEYFKLKSDILDEALKIIRKRIRQVEPKELEFEHKVNSIAASLEELLDIMKKNQITKKS